MQNFRTLRQPLLGREREKEKRAVNIGHYTLPVTPKGSERNSLGPEYKMLGFYRTLYIPIQVLYKNDERG